MTDFPIGNYYDGIIKYIDFTIGFWRETYKNAKTEPERISARCYIDAFQSMRYTITGELLP